MIRAPHDTGCDRVLRAHVVYDRDRGYRAQLRCACRARGRISATVHLRFDAAMKQARGMALTVPKKGGRSPGAATGRTAHHHHPALRKVPMAPPTPAQLDAAWRGYWRALCARNGHESRLCAI